MSMLFGHWREPEWRPAGQRLLTPAERGALLFGLWAAATMLKKSPGDVTGAFPDLVRAIRDGTVLVWNKPEPDEGLRQLLLDIAAGRAHAPANYGGVTGSASDTPPIVSSR